MAAGKGCGADGRQLPERASQGVLPLRRNSAMVDTGVSSCTACSSTPCVGQGAIAGKAVRLTASPRTTSSLVPSCAHRQRVLDDGDDGGVADGLAETVRRTVNGHGRLALMGVPALRSTKTSPSKGEKATRKYPLLPAGFFELPRRCWRASPGQFQIAVERIATRSVTARDGWCRGGHDAPGPGFKIWSRPARRETCPGRGRHFVCRVGVVGVPSSRYSW
jgi:hypothetical protein